MKRGIQIVLLLAIIIGFSNCKEKQADAIYNKAYINEIRAARKDLALFLNLNKIPGASIAISKNGENIYSEAIGYASLDLDVQVTRDTKFRIGDLSELFTSFMYLRMVDDGLLNPDSMVQHYIPDFPEKEYEVKLHHLVNQISGLREARPGEKDSQEQNVTLQKGLALFKNDQLQSYPGLDQTFNMFDNNLLGAVMENATNKKFIKILEEYVTDTLNLSNTTIDDPFKFIKGRTDFYDHNILSNIINAPSRDFRYSAPSQGLLSNAEDLVSLGNAILYSDLILKKTKETMFNPIILLDDSKADMANGWFLMIDENNNDIYGRTGNILGGSAAILLYPKLGLVIAITANLTSNMGESPIFKIADYFIKLEKE